MGGAMARDWSKVVLAAFAAAMLGACALDTSKGQDLARPQRADDATAVSIDDWLSRLFGSSPGDSAEGPANRAKGQYLVQLAAARTEEEAEALATKAKRAHAAELGTRGQSIDRVVLGNMGTFYLVSFGPFASAKETRAVCARLQGSGIDCLPMNP
jgi:SPOR domain